jgi:hypothetical protein
MNAEFESGVASAGVAAREVAREREPWGFLRRLSFLMPAACGALPALLTVYASRLISTCLSFGLRRIRCRIACGRREIPAHTERPSNRCGAKGRRNAPPPFGGGCFHSSVGRGRRAYWLLGGSYKLQRFSKRPLSI